LASQAKGRGFEACRPLSASAPVLLQNCAGREERRRRPLPGQRRALRSSTRLGESSARAAPADV
jgi:hypothetical protein